MPEPLEMVNEASGVVRVDLPIQASGKKGIGKSSGLWAGGAELLRLFRPFVRAVWAVEAGVVAFLGDHGGVE